MTLKNGYKRRKRDENVGIKVGLRRRKSYQDWERKMKEEKTTGREKEAQINFLRYKEAQANFLRDKEDQVNFLRDKEDQINFGMEVKEKCKKRTRVF